jgi:hypothetical protein
MVERLLCTKRSLGIELPPVEARERRDGGALNTRRRSQMINLSQNGMRCRAMKEIRTHEGLIRRFTEGTIQGVIDNLGRELINVEWDSGITTYAFFNEIEITDGVQLSAELY